MAKSKVKVTHCAQTTEDIDMIFFVYESRMSLSDYIKISLTSFHPFLPKFCPNVTHTCWFERRRHLTANCGRMVVQW